MNFMRNIWNEICLGVRLWVTEHYINPWVAGTIAKREAAEARERELWHRRFHEIVMAEMRRDVERAAKEIEAVIDAIEDPRRRGQARVEFERIRAQRGL